MINLKRDTKGQLKEASGLRTRASSIYNPGQLDSFKISRSKFSDFLTCTRCFYLDRVKGLASPGMPGWSLNVAVDDLLKKEFDRYRENREPHPIFREYNLNFVPYQHQSMDKWRNSLSGGIEYHDKETNIIFTGGVDDIWYDLDTDQLVVIDYKAQSSSKAVNQHTYLNSVYHQGYKMQLDFYAFVLSKMGFDVSCKGYFLVCNADKSLENFNNSLKFDTHLIEYEVQTDWIAPKITEMKDLLDCETVPDRNPYCENCAYIEAANDLKNNE